MAAMFDRILHYFHIVPIEEGQLTSSNSDASLATHGPLLAPCACRSLAWIETIMLDEGNEEVIQVFGNCID